MSNLVRTLRARGAIPAALAVALVAGWATTVTAQQRVTRAFDPGWKFHLGDVAGGANVALDDASWRALDLPHDWSIEAEFSERNPAGASGGALPGGIGWYRKSFVMAPNDSGRLVSLGA